MKIIKWLKKLFRVVRDYDADNRRINSVAVSAASAADRCEAIVRERTSLNVDISPGGHDPNIVIMVGRYKNQDYVQCYGVQDGLFTHFMDSIQQERKYGNINRIDSPPSIRACVMREMDDRGFNF